MDKTTEDKLPPIRSSWSSTSSWHERSQTKFAAFENRVNRLLPHLPPGAFPRPDTLRDYHHPPPYQQADPQQQADAGVPSTTSEPPLFGLSGLECCRPPPPYSPVKQLDGSYSTCSISMSNHNGSVSSSTNSLKREDDAQAFNTNLRLQIQNVNLRIERSVAEIHQLVNFTHKIRKPYKHDLRPRIPDREPNSSTANDISPSTSPNPSDGGIALAFSNGLKTSQVKHKIAEQNRRKNLDRWIRRMDDMLPDHALESIGFCLDGKKNISKEQVLEATVWYLEQLVEVGRESIYKTERTDDCTCQRVKVEYGLSQSDIERIVVEHLNESRTAGGPPGPQLHPAQSLNRHYVQPAPSMPMPNSTSTTIVQTSLNCAVPAPLAATSRLLICRRATGDQKRFRNPEQEEESLSPEKRLRPDTSGYY